MKTNADSTTKVQIDDLKARACSIARSFVSASGDALTPQEQEMLALGFVAVKRFSDLLLPSWERVQEAAGRSVDAEEADELLIKASGLPYYNTSTMNLADILQMEDGVLEGLVVYLGGFSKNVLDIVAGMQLPEIVGKLDREQLLSGALWILRQKDMDLSAEAIGDKVFLELFSEVIRFFEEEILNKEMLCRDWDMLSLMAEMLADGRKAPAKTPVFLYDMAMGTGCSLGLLKEKILRKSPKADVRCCGQDTDPYRYAIAMTYALAGRKDEYDYQLGNALSEDIFKGRTFDYCIAVPPLMKDWKKEEMEVEEEYRKEPDGRFSPGLPRISDSQMLFLLDGIYKLAPGGRMAIVQSYLTLEEAKKGAKANSIRRYIFGNDWVEAIVRMSASQYKNKAEALCVFILNKDKPEEKKNKVQLIDADKNIGKRRRVPVITPVSEYSDLILTAYRKYKNALYHGADKITVSSRVVELQDLGLWKVVVEHPQMHSGGWPLKRFGKIIADPKKREVLQLPIRCSNEEIQEFVNRTVRQNDPYAEIDWEKSEKTYVVDMDLPAEETGAVSAADPEINELRKQILSLEEDISRKLKEFFDKEGSF